MKIEFLDDISDGGRFPDADPSQLVRLYDFDSFQANQLRQAIQENVIDCNREIDLASFDFIHSVNCNLILKISDTDKGIITADNKNFACILTVKKYEEMAFLMEPFSYREVSGYQWLYDLDAPIDFLFSPGGSW